MPVYACVCICVCVYVCVCVYCDKTIKNKKNTGQNESAITLNGEPSYIPSLNNILLPAGHIMIEAIVIDGLNAITTTNLQCQINVLNSNTYQNMCQNQTNMILHTINQLIIANANTFSQTNHFILQVIVIFCLFLFRFFVYFFGFFCSD